LYRCKLLVSILIGAFLFIGCGGDDFTHFTEPLTEAEILLIEGIDALKEGNLDVAVNAFEAAYVSDPTNQEAIVYSTLARLASIAVDDKVKALMSERLGIKNYPGTLNKLITPDWLETYTHEEVVGSYRDGTGWVYWCRADDWIFNYYGLPPKAGYYRWQSLSQSIMHLGETVRRVGQLNSFLDVGIGNWVYWHGVNSWIFNYYGLTPQAGYYYEVWNQNTGWSVVLYSTEPWEGNLPEYWDYETGRRYEWRDTAPSGWTGFTVPGYYWQQSGTYTFVSETPQYRTRSSSFLPGLDVPSWFANTNLYKDSFTSTQLQSYTTFALLMVSNLIDKNTNGLNNLLDELIEAVFGANFEAAYNRVATLNNRVKISKDMLDVFGISEIFEGEEVYINKAELNILFSAMHIIKASLEWVAAYDWNTDLNFLRNGATLDDYLQSSSAKNVFFKGPVGLRDDNSGTLRLSDASLPLRNNFLKDRNNGMMEKSKASFVKAIDDAIGAYNLWVGDSSNLPQAYRDILAEFIWVRDGLNQLKNAINTGGTFYVREHDAGTSTYSNIASGALLGINMGKFFTPGHFSLENMIETKTVPGRGIAPKFYGFTFDDWDWEFTDTYEITSREQIVNYNSGHYKNRLGFMFKTNPITEVIVYGLDLDLPQTIAVDLIRPDYALILWDWYHD
jgi:hypothetical protein